MKSVRNLGKFSCKLDGDKNLPNLSFVLSNKVIPEIEKHSRDYTINYFAQLPRGFWDYKKNQVEFLEWLGPRLGFNELNNWYKVTSLNIRQNGGSNLLAKFGNSPSKLLSSVYPKHKWNLSRFETVPMGFWNKKSNQKEFMDCLGKQLGFVELEDWYQITQKVLCENGGAGLLAKYERSPSLLLRSVYEGHRWLLWRFKNVARGIWNQIEPSQRVELTLWLEKQLHIKEKDDWYRVSLIQIEAVISLELFEHYPLQKLLQEAYPNYQWDLSRLHCSKEKQLFK